MKRRLPKSLRAFLRQHQRELLIAAAAIAIPIALLNWAVAYLGDTHVFLLSPFSLKAKAKAVETYMVHRPICLVRGHPPMEPLIVSAERKYHLPPGLLRALIETESGARPHRISPTGAMGPGQLVPSTARALHVDDPFDSAEAVEGSARYLAEQLHRFHNVRLAVAAYNAGPQAVHGHVPHNGETEFYVAHVMTRYQALRPKPARARAVRD